MSKLTFKKERIGSRIVYSIRDGGIVIFPPGKYNKKYFVDSKYKELKTKEFNDLKSAKEYVVNYLTEIYICGENKMAKKKQKLDEGMVMISSLLPVGGLIGMPPKRTDNFKFKGLPGQFNEHGEKVLDEFGDPIKEEKLNEAKNDYVAKYGGTLITIKDAYKWNSLFKDDADKIDKVWTTIYEKLGKVADHIEKQSQRPKEIIVKFK